VSKNPILCGVSCMAQNTLEKSIQNQQELSLCIFTAHLNSHGHRNDPLHGNIPPHTLASHHGSRPRFTAGCTDPAFSVTGSIWSLLRCTRSSSTSNCEHCHSSADFEEQTTAFVGLLVILLATVTH